MDNIIDGQNRVMAIQAMHGSVAQQDYWISADQSTVLAPKSKPIIFLGPMGTGKSQTLIDVMGTVQINSSALLADSANQDINGSVLLPRRHAAAISCATIGDKDTITSRTGEQVLCAPFDKFGSLANVNLKLVGTVVIDELQFLPDESHQIYDFLQRAIDANVHLVIAGLAYNLNSKLFPAAKAFIDSGLCNIIWLESVCDACGMTGKECVNIPYIFPSSGRISVQKLWPRGQYVKLCPHCRGFAPEFKVITGNEEAPVDEQIDTVTEYLSLNYLSKLA